MTCELYENPVIQSFSYVHITKQKYIKYVSKTSNTSWGFTFTMMFIIFSRKVVVVPQWHLLLLYIVAQISPRIVIKEMYRNKTDKFWYIGSYCTLDYDFTN